MCAGRARCPCSLAGSPRRDTSASASVGSSHKPPAPPPDRTPKPGTSHAPTLPAPSFPTIASGCRHPRCRRRDLTGTRITSEFFRPLVSPRLPFRSLDSFSRESATRRSAGFPIARMFTLRSSERVIEFAWAILMRILIEKPVQFLLRSLDEMRISW